MAPNRTSSPKSSDRGKAGFASGGTRHGIGAGSAFLILAGLIVVGIIAILIISGLAAKGIKETVLPLKHEDIIRQQAEQKGVDAALIAAVIDTESGFKDRTSHADARGLMQITPETAKEIEKLSGGSTFELEDLSDPDINIRYGTFYLAHLLKRFTHSEQDLPLEQRDPANGNMVAALAAYNAGPTNAEKWGGSSMTIDDITFPETKAYVKAVLEKQRRYKHEWSLELGY